MKIIPYKKVVIKHNKSKKELSHIIANATEACRLLGNGSSSKIFCGQCEPDSFKIRRIIRYMNAYLPIINGKIYDKELVITMRMFHFTNIIMLIWMTGAIAAFFIFGISAISSLFTGNFDFLNTLIGLSLAPIGFFILKIGFWNEVEKAEAELNKLINS